MPLLETKGAGSAQGFGLTLGGAEPVYIEDVFSTYLYTGSGSTQTITNGIDLAGEGGLVWCKNRGAAAHGLLFDTARGATKYLISSLTNAEGTSGAGERLTAFNSNGFSLGTDPGSSVNASSNTYASWTFRKAEKFFDVVTYTGNGSARTIAHSLGQAPGMIIVKCTSAASSWFVWHRDFASNEVIYLEQTAAKATGVVLWNNTLPTATEFSLGAAAGVNTNGASYVAYLFAHDAGGFGDDGTENVISCGSYTGNGSSTGPTVTLGYEPQWIMVKRTDSTGSWLMLDIMRGIPNTPGVAAGSAYLFANSSNAEDSAFAPFAALSATGFSLLTSNAQINASAGTYIYIAIRRGPMKVPTSGTSVFSPIVNSNSTGATNTTGFPVDLQLWNLTGGYQTTAQDRLRGVSTTSTQTSCPELVVPYTYAESSNAFQVRNWNNTGFETPSAVSGSRTIWWNFRRAPGFFDVVCYTGTGTTATVSHNLGVAPEMFFVKKRNNSEAWVARANAGNNVWKYGGTESLSNNFGFNSTNAAAYSGTDTTSYTSTYITTYSPYNSSGGTYVAYLFATCPGVSKVGSYTGSGTTKQIDCGFTGGARFVMIKRTDSTGDWYVWDSARGIVAGNDPYLLLNSTAAEVTSTDYVDTYSAGFEISSTAPAAINANGGTFIFLAIA